VNQLDLLLVVIGIAAAVAGYRLGFLARVTSWVGLALGVVAGSLLLPEVIRRLEDAGDATLAAVAISVLAGCALVGQAAGLVLGSQLHIALPDGAARRTDQVAGGVAGIIGLLVGLWLLLPALADMPGWAAEQARGSTIAQEVSELFPQAPDTIQALRRLVGEDPFPPVFDSLRPSPEVGPPPPSTGMTEETAQRVAQSVVKIEGEACGRIQEGTGFFVTEDLIVTNAHVVAGEDQSAIHLAGGDVIEGRVVAFDPSRDLAVLRTDGPAGTPLPLSDAELQDVGGVFGHPGGGPLEISPFEVGDEILAQGRDIYDSAPTERQVLVLASDLAPGDSGSALVDPNGEVIGVAFAIAPDRPHVAYALAIEELQEVLNGDLSTPRDTGSCLV
jgi:S1-C subfamily serine protease